MFKIYARKYNLLYVGIYNFKQRYIRKKSTVIKLYKLGCLVKISTLGTENF